ncbi:MAG: hypothetical protein ABL915_10705 [Gallionella sp.]
MSELNNPLPGTLLSTTEVSPEQMVHEIRVAMLPLQHAEHLDSFADNFGAGWLDPQSKQLRLQLHLVTIFSNAKIDELWLGRRRAGLYWTNLSNCPIGQPVLQSLS